MFKKKNKTIIDFINKNWKIFNSIRNKKNIIMLVFSILGTFFLYLPKILIDRDEWFMIFIAYPNLLLPSLILFWLGIYFSSHILLKFYNILLFLWLFLCFIMFMSYDGWFNLTL